MISTLFPSFYLKYHLSYSSNFDFSFTTYCNFRIGYVRFIFSLYNYRNVYISAAVFACELVNSKKFPVALKWGSESKIKFPGGEEKSYESQNDVLRILARLAEHVQIGASNSVDRIVVDHWLSFSYVMQNDLQDLLQYLDKVLSSLTFLAANRLTIADLAVFSILYGMLLSSIVNL